ncbi:MAG TPA: phosphatidate cytidylyltransferase [Chloroflexia bacterium]|nr:phosphatidate cytidylyltransferase [Chloroflexia bacterium]
MKKLDLRKLAVRTVSGAVLLAVVLAAIWVRGPLLMVAVAVAAGLAAHEFYSMARRAGYLPLYPLGVALALVLALRGYMLGDLFAGVAYVGPGVAVEVLVLVLALTLVLARQGAGWWRVPAAQSPASQAVLASPRSPYLAWADLGLTLAGAVYTGGLLGYTPFLAALPDGNGTSWLLMVLLGTAACDTGAFFVGSLLGSHKLIPHISPAKTWEGLVGGTLGAIIAAIALSGLLRLDITQAIFLGMLICAAAVAGDLCESLLKRAAGVKDSGHVIPGHGGLLDRLDSILFVVLAVYWFAQVAA